MSKLHLLLSLLSLLSLTTAEIKTVNIISDTRPMIIFHKFGFTHAGASLFPSPPSSPTSLSAPLSPPPTHLASPSFSFSKHSYNQFLLELMHKPSFCIIDSKFIHFPFTFRELSSPSHSSFNRSYLVTIPNEYSSFANYVLELQVTMDVRTELYNPDSSASKEYLSARVPLLSPLIVLIGTEWSFLEPSLQGQGGKRVLITVVIPLQVLGSMGSKKF
ncbi:unnamed protein product [Ilex paraguariensis]|uniref:CAND6/7 N-terminal domain-containing protein n=1 Tax=Ilex paraguariensis TaxID=185542 RepID=A0ABC8T5T1_9AQUA